jgi:hypothetical protein
MYRPLQGDHGRENQRCDYSLVDTMSLRAISAAESVPPPVGITNKAAIPEGCAKVPSSYRLFLDGQMGFRSPPVCNLRLAAQARPALLSEDNASRVDECCLLARERLGSLVLALEVRDVFGTTNSERSCARSASCSNPRT